MVGMLQRTHHKEERKHHVFYLRSSMVALRLCKGVNREERILKAKVMEIVILLLSLALGRMLYEKNDRFREFIDKEDY